MVDSRCNNCGAAAHKVLYAPGLAQKHQIVRCRDCGLMYAHPRLAPAVARYAAAGDGREPLTLRTPSVLRSFHKLADYAPIGTELRALLPRGRELLEVGCHAGVLLDRFRQQGWDVRGVDPDPRAAAFARAHYGLEVAASTLEGAGYAPASFDAVVMLHVIEHLDDPAQTVRHIARVLRPGGMLAVETPVYDTLTYRLLGRRERSLSCDGHVYFYTARTLHSLLGRCGFETVNAQRVGRSVSLGRLLWNVGVMSKRRAVQQSIDRLNAAWGLLDRGRLYLNVGDMIRIYARAVGAHRQN